MQIIFIKVNKPQPIDVNFEAITAASTKYISASAIYPSNSPPPIFTVDNLMNFSLQEPIYERTCEIVKLPDKKSKQCLFLLK